MQAYEDNIEILSVIKYSISILFTVREKQL